VAKTFTQTYNGKFTRVGDVDISVKEAFIAQAMKLPMEVKVGLKIVLLKTYLRINSSSPTKWHIK